MIKHLPQVSMTHHAGWVLRELPEGNFWFKGYLLGVNDEAESIITLAHRLADINRGAEELTALMESVRGHYAVVLETPFRVFAAVDKVRSIPLFVASGDSGDRIANETRLLRDGPCDSVGAIDHQVALDIGMAGYAFGNKTLFENVHLLQPGELWIWDSNRPKEIRRRAGYRPWAVIDRSREELISDLTVRTHEIFRETIESLGGRQVVIPLSAGNDSRLVAAMLREYGYDNVLCISYGIPGDFESETARSVARSLEYRWEFVPLRLTVERSFYRSSEFQEYLQFADSTDAVPYFQGLSPIRTLRDRGVLAADAIWINGNSGDFISGGHTSELIPAGKTVTDEVSSRAVERAILDKHFSLWGSLRTRDNDRTIIRTVQREWERLESEVGRKIGSVALFEYLEFINRQCKYVIAGQRTYEYYGYEWRMPLWDDRYLEFWSGVDVRWKLKQKLYSDMLRSNNFGGVWGDSLPVNKKTVRPRWVKYARNATKIPFGLFAENGKRAWRHFDRCVYYYLYDQTRMMCSIPYREVLASCANSPRHHVSFHARRYLDNHGVKLDAVN